VTSHLLPPNTLYLPLPLHGARQTFRRFSWAIFGVRGTHWLDSYKYLHESLHVVQAGGAGTHIPVPLLFLPCRFRTLSKVSTRRSATWTPGNTCCGRNKLIDSFLVVSFIMTKCDHSSPQSVFPRVPLLVWFQLPGAEKNSASLPICTGYRILASLLSYVLRLSVVWLECA